MSNLFRQFQAFCSQPKNYDAGWDVPLECWDETTFWEELDRWHLKPWIMEGLEAREPGSALAAAVQMLRPTIELIHEHREEVRAEIF